jgi:hypothetical protein
LTGILILREEVSTYEEVYEYEKIKKIIKYKNMKKRIGFLKGKSIVIGDTNIVTKNEIHISKLAEEISNYDNLNHYGSKVRIGMLEGKHIVTGDKNLVT